MAKLLDIRRIKPNPYNPNRMDDETFKSLVADIRAHGIKAIDPIHVRPLDGGLECIDGEHRLKAVGAAGFSKIWGDIRRASEAEARAMNYRKNRERGNLDPLREAELFKWELDRGTTQQQVAERYGISQPQVSARLSLLKLSDETKGIITRVIKTRYKLSPSHLEPIATLKPDKQRKLAEDIAKEHKREPPTVRDVEDSVSRIKWEEKRQKEMEQTAEKLRQAVKKSKFPKCPRCGKPAKEITYEGLPWVRCENYHEWNLLEGIRKRQSGASGGQTIPQSIKSERTLTEFTAAFRKIVSEVLKRVDANGIESISIDGKTKDGEEVSLNFSGSIDNDWYTSISLELDKQEIDLSVSNCKIKDHPEIKTRIKTREYIDSKQKLAKLEQQVEELFKGFGEPGAKSTGAPRPSRSTVKAAKAKKLR